MVSFNGMEKNACVRVNSIFFLELYFQSFNS